MIFVTGGTGLVGSHVLLKLAKKGENLKALKRTNSSLEICKNVFSFYNADALFDKINWVEGDVNDIPSLTQGMQGCEKLIHCAAIVSFYSSDADLLKKVNIEGTANVMNVALASDVKKVGFVSSIATLGRNSTLGMVDEECQFKTTKLDSNYALSKYYAEQEVWRASNEGLDVVIVNPSVILGPGDWTKGSSQIFQKIYKGLKKEGFNKQQASPLIEKRLKISKVLKKASKDWDGGYAMAGLLGHGDAFVLRDPSAIRPAYYYKDDEVVVVASERPVIQTVFNTSFDEIKELEAGHSIIIKKSGKTSVVPILEKRERKACSFERIYFSRGSDKEIYLERKKLGQLLFPKILKAIKSDLKNTVFSYIPNTAETSFFGLVHEAQKYISSQAIVKLLEEKQEISKENLEKLFSLKPRIEKVAIKDAKLRTFIADDANRDELVAHVYDITYGSIKETDTLVIIDDSIVRGTTLQKSILKILDRLNPKKILVVSSAPQIRYPDCYGIDMAKMEDFIAFRAAIALLKSEGKENIIKETYKDCLEELKLPSTKMKNKVLKIYAGYTDEDISNQISKILKEKEIKTQVKVIFQTVESLHVACPKNLGDWYFTGDYPTPGGNKVVNQSFVNYFEGTKKRAY